MSKIINEKALRATVALLSVMKDAKKTADELAASYQARISVMEEFIRANYTGDTAGFNELKEDVKANRARPSPYYRDRPRLAGCPTRLIVQKAQEYIKCKSQTCSDSNCITTPAKPTSA